MLRVIMLAVFFMCVSAPSFAQNQQQGEDCAVGAVGNLALDMRRGQITLEVSIIGDALRKYNLECLRGIIGRVGIGLGLSIPFGGISGAICSALGGRL